MRDITHQPSHRARKGLCPTVVAIPGSNHLYPELLYHACDLQPEHYGVHLCWCGSAFNDIGEVFTQRRLPGLDVENRDSC